MLAPISPVLFGFLVTWLRDLQRNHPTAARDVMRTTRVRSKVERSRACAPFTKTQDLRFRFFRACVFHAKNSECYGFFWQCKRYNWILVFANVNGTFVYFCKNMFLPKTPLRLDTLSMCGWPISSRLILNLRSVKLRILIIYWKRISLMR